MKIFISGASGFVGGAAAASLAIDHEVLAMARSEVAAHKVSAHGAIPVNTDLDQINKQHLAGCNAVIHAAAHVEAWGPHKTFWNVNVEGTSRLLKAAREAGVTRFIHISTEVVLFAGQHMRGVDESHPYPKDAPYAYGTTKAEAERRVIEANNKNAGFTTLVIRPKMIWGPGDNTILPTTAEMVRSGRFMWLAKGKAKTSTTHIDNLVHALRLALESPRHGEIYFINDDEVHSLRDFLTRLLATDGVIPPDKSIPGWMGRGLAALLEFIWRMARIQTEPPLTRYVAGALSRDCTLSIAKARAELGYRPVISVADGLAIMSTGQQSNKGSRSSG